MSRTLNRSHYGTHRPSNRRGGKETAVLEVARRSRILVVEDDPGLRENLAELLVVTGYDVVTASNAIEALRVVREESVDLLLTDVRMPGPNGIDLIETARRERPDLRAILMTAFPEGPSFDGVRRGSVRYLRKPFDADEVIGHVERILASDAG